jgi:hypothetical protein
MGFTCRVNGRAGRAGYSLGRPHARWRPIYGISVALTNITAAVASPGTAGREMGHRAYLEGEERRREGEGDEQHGQKQRRQGDGDLARKLNRRLESLRRPLYHHIHNPLHPAPLPQRGKQERIWRARRGGGHGAAP